MPLFFWFDLSLEARAEILEIISWVFWEKRSFHKDIEKLTHLYVSLILTSWIRYRRISKSGSSVYVSGVVTWSCDILSRRQLTNQNVHATTLFGKPAETLADDWIKEFIKQKWSSGLFWAVGAAEKKKLPTAISMQLFEVFFQLFVGKKKFFHVKIL